ncbi:MAG: crossover junction endodeoxyribonuclease RuvC [Candidatus Eisenbacteria bacterium]
MPSPPSTTSSSNSPRVGAREIRILGLDPGSRRLGYGVITQRRGQWGRLDSGVIKLPEKRPLVERLRLAYEAVVQLIEAQQPNHIAIEDCFVAQSARAALVLGHVRGVLLLAASGSGAELFEFAPRSVKLASVGQGGASKEQVQQMIPRLLAACPPRLSSDEADALAVAWCCANQLRSPARLAERGTLR